MSRRQGQFTIVGIGHRDHFREGVVVVAEARQADLVVAPERNGQSRHAGAARRQRLAEAGDLPANRAVGIGHLHLNELDPLLRQTSGFHLGLLGAFLQLARVENHRRVSEASCLRPAPKPGAKTGATSSANRVIHRRRGSGGTPGVAVWMRKVSKPASI